MYAIRFPRYHPTSSCVLTPSICINDVFGYWFDFDLSSIQFARKNSFLWYQPNTASNENRENYTHTHTHVCICIHISRYTFCIQGLFPLCRASRVRLPVPSPLLLRLKASSLSDNENDKYPKKNPNFKPAIGLQFWSTNSIFAIFSWA